MREATRPPLLATLVLLAPAGWLVALGTLILHARLVAGEWPHGRRGNYFEGTMVAETIDPQALGPHYLVVLLGAMALVCLVPLVSLTLGASVFAKQLRQPPLLVAAFFVSSALVALIVILDPGGFMDWLAD